MTDRATTTGRLFVLIALAHGPKHGYEIARHLDERSRGLFAMSFGALYPILHRLEAEGLARARWQDKRKVYALTDAGAAELARLRDAIERIAV